MDGQEVSAREGSACEVSGQLFSRITQIPPPESSISTPNSSTGSMEPFKGLLTNQGPGLEATLSEITLPVVLAGKVYWQQGYGPHQHSGASTT